MECRIGCAACCVVISISSPLPGYPDGKPADMSKPVQVFLVMGQSNTLEMGKVTPELNEKYPFLVDDADLAKVVFRGRGGGHRSPGEYLTI